jgi:Fe2+ or Zn2+ uptake regulation protein
MVKSRNTKQKELIASETEKIKGIFDAEKLYDIIKNKDDSIGIATLVKSLNDKQKAYVNLI